MVGAVGGMRKWPKAGLADPIPVTICPLTFGTIAHGDIGTFIRSQRERRKHVRFRAASDVRYGDISARSPRADPHSRCPTAWRWQAMKSCFLLIVSIRSALAAGLNAENGRTLAYMGQFISSRSQVWLRSRLLSFFSPPRRDGARHRI